jgi:hypothetical protein
MADLSFYEIANRLLSIFFIRTAGERGDTLAVCA